jgi:hypothetical protein
VALVERRGWDEGEEPHRRLRVGYRGEDVRQFQIGLNARLEHSPTQLLRVPTDGVFDSKTLKGWRYVRYLIGLPLDLPPTRQAQKNVRRPQTRSPVAKRRAKRRREGLERPRIITSRQLGLQFQWVFGDKGKPFRGAGHYTAGPRADNARELAVEMRRDHRYHLSKRWGGLAYEAMVADDGTIGFGNPIDRKSAAVGGANTGLVNICHPGTTGDRISPQALQSMRWLMKNWHTRKVPRPYRLPRPANTLSWLGHKEYPANPTECPDAMLPQYKELWT